MTPIQVRSGSLRSVQSPTTILRPDLPLDVLTVSVVLSKVLFCKLEEIPTQTADPFCSLSRRVRKIGVPCPTVSVSRLFSRQFLPSPLLSLMSPSDPGLTFSKNIDLTFEGQTGDPH